jgi:hypothetical protein
MSILKLSKHNHTHILPSSRRYSSGWALASWTICLNSSFHPRLIIWFLNNLVFKVWGCWPHARGPGYPSSSVSYPLTCPAWVTTSSYATAGIALRVSGALKHHHHDKVEKSLVGIHTSYSVLIIHIFELFLLIYWLKLFLCEKWV